MQHVTIWTARRSYVGSIRLSKAASRVLCCGSEMLQIAHKWHWRYRGDHGGGGGGTEAGTGNVLCRAQSGAFIEPLL